VKSLDLRGVFLRGPQILLQHPAFAVARYTLDYNPKNSISPLSGCLRSSCAPLADETRIDLRVRLITWFPVFFRGPILFLNKKLRNTPSSPSRFSKTFWTAPPSPPDQYMRQGLHQLSKCPFLVIRYSAYPPLPEPP